MGGGIQKPAKNEIENIDVEGLHFDKKEIQELYKQFRKEITSGAEPVIYKKEFGEVMRAMLVTESFLQELIFNAFDTNRDGIITWKEFIKGLSVMTRGTPEEKLTFSFNMYDLNGDGYITREDIQYIVQAFYQLCGPLSSYNGKKYDSPAQFVDEFFEELDEEATGKISLEQYKEGAQKHTEIFQALKLFTSGLPK